jgi:NADH dehydrogenase
VEISFDLSVERAPNGKLVVNECLQLPGHPEVFAVGDIASVKRGDSTLPALAQVASKGAKKVAKNIKLLAEGRAATPFFYHHSGDLISLGRWMAIGEVLGVTFWGFITWWIWRGVYLSKLISARKKLEVALDWGLNLFSPRDISQV